MFECPTHGRPMKMREDARMPGKVDWVCDDCEAERRKGIAAMFAPTRTSCATCGD